MSLHVQLKLAANPARIYKALTDSEALMTWFAEYAEVSLPEKRYDFWGRFAPGAPDQAQGRHQLIASKPDEYLQYQWQVRGVDTTVNYILQPQSPDHTLLVIQQTITETHDPQQITLEDFWFLSLENLRRYLDGKASDVRVDFAAMAPGDIRHTVEIDGTREAVFEALIQPEQLQRWIASNATVEPKVGGEIDLGWGVGALKILELIPNEKLSYSWQEPSIVTWTLEESGGKTRLTLVNSGFAPDQRNDGIYEGWKNFASWIKSLVEYGKDWRPPTLKVAPEMLPIYPKSIGEAQDEIVVINLSF